MLNQTFLSLPKVITVGDDRKRDWFKNGL